MDKAEFISKAPHFYAVAIVAHIRRTGQETHYHAIRRDFSGHDDETGSWDHLGNRLLFDQAVQWLTSKEIIEVIPGDFGPAVIIGAPNYPKR